jgi:hypothetical protein
MSLKAIATPAAREPGPLVTRWRSRTVAKVVFDWVGRPEVGPVLGGVVVERQQLVQVVGDLGDGLAELGSVGGLELLDGVEGVLLVGHSSNATCSPVVDDEQ